MHRPLTIGSSLPADLRDGLFEAPVAVGLGGTEMARPRMTLKCHCGGAGNRVNVGSNTSFVRCDL